MLIDHQRVAAKRSKAGLYVNIKPAPAKAVSRAFYVEDHRQKPAMTTWQRTRK